VPGAGHIEVSRRLKPLIEGGVVATTASLDAEALYSARGPAEYEQLGRTAAPPMNSYRPMTGIGRLHAHSEH
jgi:hypothetical protein